MKSDGSFQTLAGHSLRPILVLRIPNFQAVDPKSRKVRWLPCVLSWNQLLNAEYFERDKLKQKIQDVFLSALRASVDDSSMKTILAPKQLLIAADTLASYRETVRAKRKLKSRNARLAKTKKNTP